jgi:hypothetical protein
VGDRHLKIYEPRDNLTKYRFSEQMISTPSVSTHLRASITDVEEG